MTSPCIWSHRLHNLPMSSLSDLNLLHKAHLLIFITSGLPLGQPQPQVRAGVARIAQGLNTDRASCLCMNILFICNQARNRSKTAARLFSDRSQTAFAGLYGDTPVTKSQLIQAGVIIVMEEKHRREIAKRFPSIYLQKQILVLGIPDIYRHEQPELVRLLKLKMPELL